MMLSTLSTYIFRKIALIAIYATHHKKKKHIYQLFKVISNTQG